LPNGKGHRKNHKKPLCVCRQQAAKVQISVLLRDDAEPMQHPHQINRGQSRQFGASASMRVNRADLTNSSDERRLRAVTINVPDIISLTLRLL